MAEGPRSYGGTGPGSALGAVLAGGRGSRLGGTKATVPLAGRAMLEYPLAALQAAGIETVVVAKPDSELPVLACPVLREPELPRHPLCGIVAALRAAEGRPLVVLACDMPFAEPTLLRRLAGARDSLVVPQLDGRLHPLHARYGAELLPALEAALADPAPLRSTVGSLGPRLLDGEELRRFGDPGLMLFNVNEPRDLRSAERLLAGRVGDG